MTESTEMPTAPHSAVNNASAQQPTNSRRAWGLRSIGSKLWRFIRAIISWFWALLYGSMILVFGGLALLLLVGMLISSFTEDQPIFPHKAALEITFSGFIVEQLTDIDPITALTAPQSIPEETLLAALLKTLEVAATDDRIELVILNFQDFLGAGPATLHQLGAALDNLRNAGKPVIAYGDYYTQSQYLLAAHADEVFLNPMGYVEMSGYGAYPLYYREMLEKLRIDMHVFRVGAFKSAVEPFVRDDMSEEAKRANADFLTSLWSAYITSVNQRRAGKTTGLSDTLGEITKAFEQAEGDTARLAINLGLVDELKTRDQFMDLVRERLNADRKEYPVVDLATYWAANRGNGLLQLPQKSRIALIYAVGEILDGEQPNGIVGGDTLEELIREARLDKRVKAIVLRVDSPGGSAYASEIIRRELERAQEDGIPVIASMGSVAASGGYWISATADEIWAAPTTITGSIGIFGLLPNFQGTLDAIGVHSDGVGTTKLAGQFSLTRPLGEDAQRMIQLSIENGYQRFLSLVSEGRGLSLEEVDAIAQGRVWTGETALRLGLIDNLGSLNDAISAAAERASLTDYDVQLIEKPLSPEEKLIRQLFEWAHFDRWANTRKSQAPELAMINNLRRELGLAIRFNDPRGMYALCETCPALATGRLGTGLADIRF